jgi:glycosyltransferase involved in cell wall biosynthesis
LDVELVSVIIPTKNSSATISACIESVKNQSYSHVEIIVVDTNSTDGTVKLCEMNNTFVVKSEWQMLGSRSIGLSKSSGKYILMLDSDQFLEAKCIENCVNLMKECDMICLEETTFDARTMIQKMCEADRKLIHENADIQLDPLYGVLAPRFYSRLILEKVFAEIPKEILPFTTGTEDKIVYYEARKLSKKVKILPNALAHKESEGLVQLWRKNHRYGKSDRQLARTGHYSSLLSNKMRLRKSRGLSKNRILSSTLLLLKAPAYMAGFYFG